jgi:nucleoside-diphosphate-sugar epimerase
MTYRLGRVAVVGGRGFVGSAVARRAEEAGYAVDVRSHEASFDGEEFDAVVYCSGVAWGAQERPLDAFETHVSAVARILRTVQSGRFIYLSSTRVYDGAASTDEAQRLILDAPERIDAYRASKIAGEGVVLCGHRSPCVLRLSNVYGPSFDSGLFLSDILRQAGTFGKIDVRTSEASSKDYVSVEDVAKVAIDVCGLDRVAHVYNVARGKNTTHGEIFSVLRAQNVDVGVPDDAPTSVAPQISVDRLARDVSWQPRDVLADLPDLLRSFQVRFGD